jgi:hypothetical protein
MTLSLCLIVASDTPILPQGEPFLPPPHSRISPILVATLLVLAALAWTATIALARSPAAMSVMPAALAAGPAMRLMTFQKLIAT